MRNSPAPPTKLGDVVMRTVTGLGTKFAKFTVCPGTQNPGRDELCRKCRRPCRASYTCNHSRRSEEGRNRFARREAVQIGKFAGWRCWRTIEVNRKGAGSEERGR